MTDEKTQQPLGVASDLNAELDLTSDEKQHLAAALMPCGAVVSNVYEAYKAGVKAERERHTKVFESLKAIAYPVKYLAEEARKDGYEIDGQIAIQLSNDANYIKQIAQRTLKELDING